MLAVRTFFTLSVLLPLLSTAQVLTFQSEISGFEKGYIQFAGWKWIDINNSGLLVVADPAYQSVYVIREDGMLRSRFRMSSYQYANDEISSIAINHLDQIVCANRFEKRFAVFTATGEFIRNVYPPTPLYALNFDEDNNMYALGAQGIYKYDPQWNLEYIFGDAVALSGAGYAEVRNGKVYVSEKDSIHIYTTEGEFINKFRTYGDPNGLGAVSADESENIYVANSGWSRIDVFSPQGVLQRKIQFSHGYEPGQVSVMASLTIDKNGNIHIGTSGHKVQVFENSGILLKSFGDSFTKDPAILHFPSSMDFDHFGNLNLINASNAQVKTFDDALQVIQTFVPFQSSSILRGHWPNEVVVDSRQRKVVVTDDAEFGQRVRLFSESGTFIKELENPDNFQKKFSHQVSIEIGQEDTICIYDQQRVYKYSREGDFLFRFQPEPLPEVLEESGALLGPRIDIDADNNLFLIQNKTGLIQMYNGVKFKKTFFTGDVTAFAADAERRLLYMITPEGLLTVIDYDETFQWAFQIYPPSGPKISNLWDVAVNPVTHHIFLSDPYLQRVLEYKLRMPQTITFDLLPLNEQIDKTYELRAVSSSNLPVSFSVDNHVVATVEGNVLTLHGSGTINITATQAGNEHFLEAEPVTHTLNVEIILGIGEAAQASTVYPNPAVDNIRIDCVSPESRLSITDMMGNQYGVIYIDTNTLDISALSPGIYLLTIQNKSQRSVVKIVKK